jgi:outer membrane protein OmpA-like peptidoglycan-associated protein
VSVWRVLRPFVVLLSSLAWWASPAVLAQSDTGQIQALGPAFAPVKEVIDGQSRLIIYRAVGEGSSSGVITLHMDGRYHTSLQNGAFSMVCLSGAITNLQAQPGRSWARADPEREVSQSVVMSSGQTLYVRLSEPVVGRPKIEVVPLSVAAQEIVATRQQIHSISRVINRKPCISKVHPTLAMAPDVLTLSAQTVQDASAMAAVVQRLAAKYAGMGRVEVHVVGHVEDGTTEALNQTLSASLAEDAKRQFARASVTFGVITSEGRGSKDRLSTDSQLRRRVEIGITILEN